ncbi:hypothetical protein AMTRI_Chr11g154560 [Amborella trichopoda]
MMHAVALGFVITSLAAAGVWSPPPPQPNTVKEGHRVIVVEYERELPQHTQQHKIPADYSGEGVVDREKSALLGKEKGVAEKLKEKYRDAACVLPNLGQGLSSSAESNAPRASNAKDKLCDAYGVCKDRISDIFGAAKDKVAQKVSESGERVADKVFETKDAIADKLSDAEESAKHGAEKLVHSGEELIGKAKTEIAHSGEEVNGKAKNAGKMASESIKKTGENVFDNITKGGNKIKGGMRTAKKTIDTSQRDVRHNLTDIIHRGWEVIPDAWLYAISPETLVSYMVVIHTLSFGVAYGVCVWVTFVLSHVLSQALPRQQFALVQSKIYPVYFRTMMYSLGLCFLTHFFRHPWRNSSNAEKLQSHNLLACLGLVLVNMLYLEPQATKVMFERLKMEKEEGRGRDIADIDERQMTNTTTTTATTSGASGLSTTGTTISGGAPHVAMTSKLEKMSKRLKSLNGYSSLLNLVALMGLTWHVCYLSQCMMEVGC